MVEQLPRRSSTSSSPPRWRRELDRIEEGELGWQQVLQDFYGPFTKALRGGGPRTPSSRKRTGSSPKSWPRSAAPSAAAAVELNTGRFGPYFACVNYKQTCDYVKSLKKGRAPDRPTRREVPALRRRRW